jgi:integrase|tara:strand:- start:99 stop:1145 length:1047 start_codon:yes stop_codon:yes gene_type:complete
MSSLYKRKNSPYFWWATIFKGRSFAKSTKTRNKSNAKKIQEKWDFNLMMGNLEFLELSSHPSANLNDYIMEYLKFIEKRKSDNAITIAKGVLRRFLEYAESAGVSGINEITVKIINGYLDSLNRSPKTKKNHLQEISLLLEQAIKEDVIAVNLAKKATLPRMVKSIRHRLLEPVDLSIIFQGAGSWHLYYSFLYHTGLRAGDVALLKYGNIDFQKKAITSFVRKSRRIHEFPLAQTLIDSLDADSSNGNPIFPSLYAETERKLNDNLAKPRLYLQALLKAENRPPKADLHSLRHTFNNTLRDLGLSMDDRKVLMAQASSEANKIYTHPNFDLASRYVNQIPTYGNFVG